MNNNYLYTTLFFVNLGIIFERVPKGKTSFKPTQRLANLAFALMQEMQCEQHKRVIQKV